MEQIKIWNIFGYEYLSVLVIMHFLIYSDVILGMRGLGVTGWDVLQFANQSIPITSLTTIAKTLESQNKEHEIILIEIV